MTWGKYHAVLGMAYNHPEIVFSHPDFTVGTGISPVQPLIRDKRVMDFTIGRDLHPTPKTFRFYSIINIVYVKEFVNALP